MHFVTNYCALYKRVRFYFIQTYNFARSVRGVRTNRGNKMMVNMYIHACACVHACARACVHTCISVFP